MRVARAIPELMLWLLIVAIALVNLGVYSDVVRGEDAINLRTSAVRSGASPAGSALSTPSPSQVAELDDSDSLPGRFVATQGRQHTASHPLKNRVPFCPHDKISDECYASNPPTSGLHLPVQATVTLDDGNRLKIPPDPGVYVFPVPREAIPHVEEHAGVYIGYNCASDACNQHAERLKDLVTQELSLGARVVLSPDPDLDDDTIGMAAWTRVDTFAAPDYEDDRVRRFIKAHSCRFDPERFCLPSTTN